MQITRSSPRPLRLCVKIWSGGDRHPRIIALCLQIPKGEVADDFIPISVPHHLQVPIREKARKPLIHQRSNLIQERLPLSFGYLLQCGHPYGDTVAPPLLGAEAWGKIRGNVKEAIHLRVSRASPAWAVWMEGVGIPPFILHNAIHLMKEGFQILVEIY